MKVSIIVPAYNEEKNIAKTLEGLKNQDYSDFELIVVDNNSKDRTQEIAKEYTNKVFFEPKKGYMNAVTKGVEESTGDLLPQTDWFTRWLLREQEKKTRSKRHLLLMLTFNCRYTKNRS